MKKLFTCTIVLLAVLLLLTTGTPPVSANLVI